jgi:hypothetical protein
MDQTTLKTLLQYNPETGEFIRLQTHGTRGLKGKVAGTKQGAGYIQIKLLGKFQQAHRLACLYMTGKWPEKEVDHMDGNPGNNVWINLRECTPSENQYNTRLPKNNTSGVKGVSYNKASKKWVVQLSVRGMRPYLGRYDDLELAEFVANEARQKYHGLYARNS